MDPKSLVRDIVQSDYRPRDGGSIQITAVSARLVDTSGRILDDDVENGVFLFMWEGDINLRSARLELLDADRRLTRSGPLRHGS